MRSLPMATEVLPAEEGEAEGCVQCQQGSKLVLFVTGKCHWGCDYCPLSENRRETPDMFANERRCTSWDEVIEEGQAMNATGTGITGGDPMLDLEKTLEAVRQLKKIPEVIECHYTTGNWSVLAKILCRDNEHLMQVLNSKVQNIKGISRTETYISLEQQIQRQIQL